MSDPLEPDQDALRDADEERKRRAAIWKCECNDKDMPGYCPGPRNCPMVGVDDPDDSPYCECNEQPIEEELASGTCFACGKELL
jgi:hypothetical protein